MHVHEKKTPPAHHASGGGEVPIWVWRRRLVTEIQFAIAAVFLGAALANYDADARRDDESNGGSENGSHEWSPQVGLRGWLFVAPAYTN